MEAGPLIITLQMEVSNSLLGAKIIPLHSLSIESYNLQWCRLSLCNVLLGLGARRWLPGLILHAESTSLCLQSSELK